MAKSFRCSIVTPMQTVLDDEITYASVPAWDGQLGVMTSQSPTLTKLGIGALRLDFEEGGSRWYLIEGGFAQIASDHLNIITDRATASERLSLAEAESELDEANGRVVVGGKGHAQAEVDQRRALAKVALARAAAGRGHAI
ncbi:MAG: F0F1 ATP synthase subunit epsilon [Phycisphaerales bacterium]|nr:F0F1 ATP synthase subunit epsilon [Phycisphaerales bacterium]